MRIAAGGRLNSTPPTVMGNEGASGAIAFPGQRGHSTSATKPAANTIRATSVSSANSSPAEVLPFLAIFACCLVMAVIGSPNHREYAMRHIPHRHGEFSRRLPFIKDALARPAAIWEGQARQWVLRRCHPS